MTHPGGGGGPRPSGPAGPGPKEQAARIVAAITPEIRAIADSLPDLKPSVMERVADIWRRTWRLGRYDRAA